MNKKIIIYVASMSAFAGPFTQSIYTPLLPSVQAAFGTNVFFINLSISIFTFILAGMQFVYGPLVDSKGRRKVLLPGLLLFVMGSVGAAVSFDIYMFLFFRIVQAAGIAAGSVVAATVIGDLYEGKLRGRAMGTFQTLVALGSVAGPIVGGIIGEHVGFQGVFWTLVLFGGLLFCLSFFCLPETRPDNATKKQVKLFDFWLIIKNKAGFAIMMLAFVQYFTFYNFLVFLPSILTLEYGLTISQNGFVFLPLTTAVVIGSLVGGRIQEYFHLKVFIVTLAALNVSMTFLFCIVALASLSYLIISIALFGLCLGLSLPVQTTLLINNYNLNRAKALSMYNLFRYLGMAFGPLVGSFFYQKDILLEFYVSGILFSLIVIMVGFQFFDEQREAFREKQM